MTRWVSLLILLAVIAGTGYLLYQIMSSFLLPLFLAVVLAVIFRPLHDWLLRRCHERQHVAALLTTLTILATVLLPFCGILTLAIYEGLDTVRGGFLQQAEQQIGRLRERVRLNLPFETFADDQGDAVKIHHLESLLSGLPDELPDPDDITREQRQEIRQLRAYLEALDDRVMQVRREVEQNPQSAGEESLQQRCIRQLLSQEEMVAFDALADVREILVDVDNYLQQPPSPDNGATDDETAAPTEEGVVTPSDEIELRRRFTHVKTRYDAFRVSLMGGPVWSWLRDLANPGSQQLESWIRTAERYLSGWLPSFAGQATALLGRMLVNLAIMALALFYFLKDGSAMIRTLMRLSPLDDRHEERLLVEFNAVSRAVVVATLLSALVQGLLAAPAYYLAGFQPVFLLTALTMVMALVPFVGAAAVWLPATVWLAFVDQRFAAAGALLIYGVVVISMADNVVKPYVLAGRSKLHPLLGLLSVLGGVQAMGPIGILVGPMIVSFLQALLTLLNQELMEMDANATTGVPPAADACDA